MLTNPNKHRVNYNKAADYQRLCCVYTVLCLKFTQGLYWVFSGDSVPFLSPESVPRFLIYNAMKNNDLSPVRLRTKNLSSGRASLYLDIVKDGERRKEYLGLYLLPELTKADANANKATMKIAEEIRAKRMVDLIEGRLSFAGDKAKRTDLLTWLEEQQTYYYNNNNTNYSKTIHNLIRHIRLFRGDKLTMKDVTPGFLRSFLDYLKGNVNKYGGKLSDETIYTYFTVLSILMNKAVRYEIIAANPFHKLSQAEKPQRRTKKKEYLTLDEVKRMAEAECDDIRVKRAFLFCCFTGLRYIDVSRLKWKHISEIGEGEYQIEVVQQKTKEPVYIPLSANALRWIPDRGDDGRENYVFKFRDRSIIYDYLDRWAKKAGIEKHVTFHMSRHTCATLLLYYGADLYTVSKILGHTSIKTTQIYAKVADEMKRKAVSDIPEIK